MGWLLFSRMALVLYCKFWYIEFSLFLFSVNFLNCLDYLEIFSFVHELLRNNWIYFLQTYSINLFFHLFCLVFREPILVTDSDFLQLIKTSLIFSLVLLLFGFLSLFEKYIYFEFLPSVNPNKEINWGKLKLSDIEFIWE